VLDAGLRTVGGVRVPADLDLEHLHGRAVPRLEQVVQHLRPLRLRVVDEQPAVPATTADGADAVKHPTIGRAADRDGGSRRRRRGLRAESGDGDAKQWHDG
jgi:hypothetical protein